MRQHKAIHDKTRQDYIIQDKTIHIKRIQSIVQDKPIQYKTIQDNIRSYKTRQENTL